jgi:hypothetical protein
MDMYSWVYMFIYAYMYYSFGSRQLAVGRPGPPNIIRLGNQGKAWTTRLSSAPPSPSSTLLPA